MTFRMIIVTAALTSIATLGTIGSASAGGGGKITFERNKPHVIVGSNEKGQTQFVVQFNNSRNARPAIPRNRFFYSHAYTQDFTLPAVSGIRMQQNHNPN